MPSEVSLVQCVNNCLVASVPNGTAHGPIFNLSGTVTNLAGIPVPGATVVLRESPQLRVSSEPKVYLEVRDRHLVAVGDVFAKTTADENGVYRFEDVKSPSLPQDRFRERWRWTVIAVSEDGCVGTLQLDGTREPYKFDHTANIVLLSTATIEGIVTDEAGGPQADAIVSLSSLCTPAENNGPLSPAFSERGFVAWMSVFSPVAKTRADGRFAFHHVPVGQVALLQAKHPDFNGGTAAVATSSEIKLGSYPTPELGRNKSREVTASPARIQMEVGQLISGKVTHNGEPLKGVRVSVASGVDGVETNLDGEFQLRYSKSRVSDGQAAKLFVRAHNTSVYLSRLVDVSAEQLEQDAFVEVHLAKGIRIHGSVICMGEPVAGIEVQVRPNQSGNTFSRGGKTREDGTYECILSSGDATLFPLSETSAYKLPSSYDATEHRGVNVPREWPQLNLQLSENNGVEPVQVEPIEIERADLFELHAQLPNGRPAKNAVVSVKDPDPWGFPYADREISNEPILDGAGKTSVLLRRKPSSKAYVTVSLTGPKGGYSGEAQISDLSSAGELHIALTGQCVVRGRVTLNGKPVIGARVSVGKSTRVALRTRRERITTTTTDAEGQYTVYVNPAVPPQQFSAFVLDIPGVQSLSNNSNLAIETSPGVFEVRDFAFWNGSESISGRAVDGDGNPLAGITVRILPAWGGGVRPLIVEENSLKETDEKGRFSFEHLPPGEYHLQTSFKPPNGRSTTVRKHARTGEQDIKIIVVQDTAPPTPVLKIKSITDY